MTEKTQKTDGRHPYTYAADYIRSFGPVDRSGVVLSRGDASQILEGIARAIGMDDEELANLLSLAEQNKTDDDIKKQTQKVMQALGY